MLAEEEVALCPEYVPKESVVYGLVYVCSVMQKLADAHPSIPPEHFHHLMDILMADARELQLFEKYVKLSALPASIVAAGTPLKTPKKKETSTLDKVLNSNETRVEYVKTLDDKFHEMKIGDLLSNIQKKIVAEGDIALNDYFTDLSEDLDQYRPDEETCSVETLEYAIGKLQAQLDGSQCY